MAPAGLTVSPRRPGEAEASVAMGCGLMSREGTSKSVRCRDCGWGRTPAAGGQAETL